jgi:hypothetical protein
MAREPLEDGPAGGVGEGFEDVICQERHGGIITSWLLVVKNKVDRAPAAIVQVPEQFSSFEAGLRFQFHGTGGVG